MEDIKQSVWVEKYRPKTMDELVLPESTLNMLKSMVEKEEIPNLLFYGPTGTGKTSAARAMVNALGADCLFINGSLKSNIDTLRTEIMRFASSVSFSDGRKFVILDESDFLNAQSTQPALRSFMEQYSQNCGFILTCNYKNRMLDALQSRNVAIDFTVKSEDRKHVMQQMYKRVVHILKSEGIDFNPKVVQHLVLKFYPDFRRLINYLQAQCTNGKLDEGALSASANANFKAVFEAMRDKDFAKIRKWVAENMDIESAEFYKTIYDELPTYMKGAASICESMIFIAKYQYQEAFAASTEINRAACLTDIMIEATWK